MHERLAADELQPALKGLARVKHIQRALTDQWAVLATLTPSEYAEFRGSLGTSSGFQSDQYRAVEFVLGNKNAEMLTLFAHDERAHAQLAEVLARPSLYDEFLRYLARHGHAVPAALLDRDVTRRTRSPPTSSRCSGGSTSTPDRFWEAYEACEELVDLEENFQFWRFRHLKTVERTIGWKRGTGGSSGVEFLRAALELTFFPELYAVRTEIGRVTGPPIGPAARRPRARRRRPAGRVPRRASCPARTSSPTWTATRWAARWPIPPNGSTAFVRAPSGPAG